MERGYEDRYRDRVLLSDRDILAEIDAKRISVEPYDESMIQPSSIDFRLDRFFRVFENAILEDFEIACLEIRDELVATIADDHVRGHEIDADPERGLLWRPLLGRLGLLTHATAGFVDPGFSGHVTLELANVATLPIKLYPGMKIGQLCFFRLSSPAEHPYGSEKYGSRYQGQRGPTPSKSYANFHRTRI